MPEPWSPERLTSAAHAALCSASLAPRRGPLRPGHVFGAVGTLRESVAGRALNHLGLRWSDLGLPSTGAVGRAQVRLRRGQRPSRRPAGAGETVLSEVGRELFERAAREARELGHHPINTGHLVLAILRPEAGPLPADSALSHAAFAGAVKEVLARPWVHGYALDGEFVFYLTRDETLVLYAALSRRRARARAGDAEETVVSGLLALMRPVCGELLSDGLERLDRARRAVLRLARGRGPRG